MVLKMWYKLFLIEVDDDGVICVICLIIVVFILEVVKIFFVLIICFLYYFNLFIKVKES